MQGGPMKRSRAVAAALLLAGCPFHNSPVTSPPAQQNSPTRKLPQAKTALLRVDHVENGNPVSRFIVTFNDDTDAAIPDGNSWQYDPNGVKSTSGWAISTDGKSWTRQSQIVASAALQQAGLNALHGDPWIAGWNSKDPNSPSVALYVSIGQTGLKRFGPPWYLAAARSMDSGVSFQPPVIVYGPNQNLPDGPKVAVTGDGNYAIVAWHGAGIQYKVLSGIRSNAMTIPPDNGGVHDILPAQIATPPVNCNVASPILHPQVAATLKTFYMTVRVAYCNDIHFEVYRADAAKLANGQASFVRVLSVKGPGGASALAAQNLMANSFAQDFDRGGLGMSLVAGADQFGDYVLLAAQRTDTVQGENSHNEIVYWRLGQADTC